MTKTDQLSASRAGTVRIGDSSVNRLGFGAMRITGPGIWGWPADQAAAVAVLKRAVEIGVAFVDTADSYGPNTSEELIAEALWPYEGLMIATKGGFVRRGPDQWTPNCRPEHLRTALEGSLRRLKVAQIPLYQLHGVDPAVPFVDALQTLIAAKDEGLIKHIGLSNVTIEHLRIALNLTEIVSVQNHYNLSYRRTSEPVLRFCEEKGMAFIPFFPIGGNQGGVGGDALEDVARKHGTTTRQIAIAWLLDHSPAMLPIPGTGTIAHLEENVAAAAITLDDDDRVALNALSD